MKESRFTLILALTLLIVGASLRLLPHPANFAPVAAIAIFGGATLPRKFAIWMPVAIMMISDAFIGFYGMMPLVWACYLVTALASSYLLKKPSLLKGATLTLSASLFFYIVTNFGVWLTGNMYTHSWSGLVQCYVMAVPFFRNTVVSDIVYTAAFFGIFAFAKAAAKNRLYAVPQEI